MEGDWAFERNEVTARWSHVRVCEFAEENAPDRPTHEQQGGEGRRPKCDGLSRALIQLRAQIGVAHEQSVKGGGMIAVCGLGEYLGIGINAQQIGDANRCSEIEQQT